MATVTGYVTYAAAKTSRNDASRQYGMVSIEGMFFFCNPNRLPPANAEIKAVIQVQQTKNADGTYNTNQSIMVWNLVSPVPAPAPAFDAAWANQAAAGGGQHYRDPLSSVRNGGVPHPALADDVEFDASSGIVGR